MVEDLDQHAATAEQHWQVTAGQHAVATRGEQRLNRTLRTARRRLEQPERRESPSRRPRNGPPTPGQIVEPEPPSATHEAPSL